VNFAEPLVRGTLIRREKRFLVHVLLDDGREVIAHTNNTGTMLGCNTPGSPVWLSPADNPKRKLKWTYELIEADGVLAGINTMVPNRLAQEGVEDGTITELQGYDNLRREVRYGENSRIDLLLERGSERCWVEVKNVTLTRDGAALFPDAVTERGRKHLRELTAQVAAGDRAVMLYVVQRVDAERFAPADNIDPAYGAALREAAAAGVEALCYKADVSPESIRLARRLPVNL
jgi:sugar fermentation stimulation protein A